jgi:soluble lytic murein transglycosylase-like protein
MQMINIIRILIAVFCSLITLSVVHAKEINQNAKVFVSKSVKDKLDKKQKISTFIKLVQPKYSSSYISKIVDSIFKYSEKYKVNPYTIAATAYVESEFSMQSKPCIGIMQLVKSSAKYYNPNKQYNPYTLDGNIAIGTIELSHHLHRYNSRGELPGRSALKRAYERYNGSNLKKSYANKALLVQIRLENLSTDNLKAKLKKGPIWRL